MTVSVIMPVAEVCDRLTIAQLKLERLSSDQIDKTLLVKQITYYLQGIDQTNQELYLLILQLKHINSLMWDAEHDIRKGLDANLGLEEIGRRAIVIRDLNRERVRVKNEITLICNQPEFVDCKMNHISAS